MKISRFEVLDQTETLKRFSETRLRGHGSPLIYGGARLELVRQVDPETLIPAQRYVLRQDYERLIALHGIFMESGIDPFALEGCIFFWLTHPENPGEEDGPIPLTPPIIEMSREPDGRIVPLINDGMHRIYAAKKLGRKINVILAHNVPEEYPYYAYALENGWKDVVELDELPDNFIKKTYRDPLQYKALFRDFNAVFEGIQKQRKTSNPDSLKA